MSLYRSYERFLKIFIYDYLTQWMIFTDRPTLCSDPFVFSHVDTLYACFRVAYRYRSYVISDLWFCNICTRIAIFIKQLYKQGCREPGGRNSEIFGKTTEFSRYVQNLITPAQFQIKRFGDPTRSKSENSGMSENSGRNRKSLKCYKSESKFASL